MNTDATRPTSDNRRRLEVVADPFVNADAEFWRTACLLAWARALDLFDEVERLRAELATHEERVFTARLD